MSRFLNTDRADINANAALQLICKWSLRERKVQMDFH